MGKKIHLKKKGKVKTDEFERISLFKTRVVCIFYKRGQLENHLATLEGISKMFFLSV